MSRSVAWVRSHLFGSPLDSLVTLAMAAALAWWLPGLIDWAILKATWNADGRAGCAPGGACWALVRVRSGQFLYGFYPEPERWRINVATLWFLLLVALGLAPNFAARNKLLGILGLAFVPGATILFTGGLFGLAPVETREWGGLALTMVMTLSAGVMAFPLAILLALGRRSKLPFVRWVSVAFVEFWRGVPIVAVIFLASIMLPLVMPEGITVDKLLRAIVGLGLVIAAYMAEVVRGGLQAVPFGQFDACKALGLSYWQSIRLIILPQALRVALPGLINEFIALLKNTTLVLIVSLFDLLGIVQAALADPNWVGLTAEAYSFAGIVFWLLCFAISRYGISLERKLAAPFRR